MQNMSKLLVMFIFVLQAWVIPAVACAVDSPTTETIAATELSAHEAHHQDQQHPCNDNCSDCGACHTHSHAYAPLVVGSSSDIIPMQQPRYSAPSVLTHQTSPPIKPPSLS